MSLQWNADTVWCSDTAPITGTTSNYGDGESVPVAISGAGADKAAFTSLPGKVNASAIKERWKVVDVLPERKGTAGFSPRREVAGRADNARTPKPLSVRFVVNYPRYSARGRKITYNRTETVTVTEGGKTVTKTEKKQPQVECNFEIDLTNNLVTLRGDLRYVRGWGKEYLNLGDATLTGGSFKYNPFSAIINHWGRQDAAGAWSYWDGTAWQPTPASWKADESNHFSAAFYKVGLGWVCRNNPLLTYPEALPDWPESWYKGAGNMTTTKLDVWKKSIENAWTDQFDLKRAGCLSALPECCRYRVRAEVTFTETGFLGAHDLILAPEKVRSDATMWALGDDRDDFLAPHEFGHLIGAPDEYAGVFSTQLGVNDSDGMKDGVDGSALMGGGKTVKKRHFKGICEVMRDAVQKEFGRNYLYEAVPKGSTAALPPETPVVKDDATARAKTTAMVIGGLAGAALGAMIGGKLSGWQADKTALGGVLGAAAGAGIGSLFVK